MYNSFNKLIPRTGCSWRAMVCRTMFFVVADYKNWWNSQKTWSLL